MELEEDSYDMEVVWDLDARASPVWADLADGYLPVSPAYPPPPLDDLNEEVISLNSSETESENSPDEETGSEGSSESSDEQGYLNEDEASVLAAVQGGVGDGPLGQGEGIVVAGVSGAIVPAAAGENSSPPPSPAPCSSCERQFGAFQEESLSSHRIIRECCYIILNRIVYLRPQSHLFYRTHGLQGSIRDDQTSLEEVIGRWPLVPRKVVVAALLIAANCREPDLVAEPFDYVGATLGVSALVLARTIWALEVRRGATLGVAAYNQGLGIWQHWVAGYAGEWEERLKAGGVQEGEPGLRRRAVTDSTFRWSL